MLDFFPDTHAPCSDSDGNVAPKRKLGREMEETAEEDERVGGRPSKRIRPVAQACQACRRNKVKCDGKRPQCTLCTEKSRTCTYVGEAGESRQAAMKSRLKALEGLLKALQAVPQDEASRMLSRLRSSNDLAWALSPDGRTSSTQPSTMDPNSPAISDMSSGLLNPAMATSDILRITHDYLPGKTRDDIRSLSSEVATVSSPSVVSSAVSSSVSSRGSKHSRIGLARMVFSLAMPKYEVTKAAVDNFYRVSGKLFHVFSQEEINEFVNTIFSGHGHPETSQNLAISAVAIVAAVGVQYHPQDFEAGKDEEFYCIAKHFFGHVVEDYPLEAVKLCTMLAMYNIMNKAMMALAYVEVALGWTKIHNLNSKLPRPYNLPYPSREDYRRTWRTLMFMAGWLSFTLGYVSGTDMSFDKLLPEIEIEADHNSEIVEMVQNEMTKISLVNANTLKMHLASTDLTRIAIETVVKDLQEWHGKLPSQMHLVNLGRRDLTVVVKISIFHVHLLYLGAFMLLYRRIASQYFQTGDSDFDPYSSSRPLEDLLLVHSQQGVTAAQHSARILGLLLHEKGIARRCWLVIFQSNTTCTVLLHTVMQKQLHHFPASDWSEDLHLAHLCLKVLQFCGTFDVVALGFYKRLAPIHAILSKHSTLDDTQTRPVPTMPPDLPPIQPITHGPRAIPDNKLYLLTPSPGIGTEQSKLSWTLLNMLCQPYGERARSPSVAGSVPGPGQRLAMAHDTASRFEAQRFEGPSWDAGHAVPVNWEEARSSIGLVGSKYTIPDNSLFLGSDAPSGWSPPVLESDDDEFENALF